jgi:hypothetical protein
MRIDRYWQAYHNTYYFTGEYRKWAYDNDGKLTGTICLWRTCKYQQWNIHLQGWFEILKPMIPLLLGEVDTDDNMKHAIDRLIERAQKLTAFL